MTCLPFSLRRVPLRSAVARVVLILLAASFPSAVSAQDAVRAEGRLAAHLRTADIRVDGILDEVDWWTAPVATGFVQQRPVEGVPAEHDTEVRVVYDDRSIWVGARMFDPDPAGIARQVVRRDDIGTADWFAVGLDPNLDRRTGYAFILQAANVQIDQYLYDDSRDDTAWDAVWDSAVTIDSLGWVAEIRIPLSQIRYEASDEPRDWGVTFVRTRVSSNEESHFKLISRTQEGVVSQFGLLTGVRIPRSSRRLELRPYALAGYTRMPVDPGDPFRSEGDLDGRVGLDLRYGLGSQFTLDATINPDFGQVEADPAVINLSAYETFFEERRPFFVEDAQVFDYRLSGGGRLFYSRRIGRSPHRGSPGGADFVDVPDNATILAATKVTGRTRGGLSLGALATVTAEERGRAVMSADGSRTRFLAEPRTGFGVVRARQDFNDGASTVGLIGTMLTRALPGDGTFDHLTRTALSGGVDWEFQWKNRTWAFHGYASGSHVRGDSSAITRIQRSSNHWFQRPDSRRTRVDSSRTSLTGMDWRATFEKRRGQHWTGSVWLAQVTPGFEVNDIGYSQRQEVLDGGARIQYQEITPGRSLRSYQFELFTFHNWSYDVLDDLGSGDAWRRSHVRGTFSGEVGVEFLNYWEAGIDLARRPKLMDRTATRGGPLMESPGAWSVDFGIRSDSRKKLSLGPEVSFSFGDRDSGRGWGVELDVRYRPSDRAQISFSPQWSAGRDATQYVDVSDAMAFAPTYGRRYLFGEIERRELSLVTRVGVAFTPRLSLQVYLQPLFSSGDYTAYKQLSAPETYTFDVFEEGAADGSGGCVGGRTCVDGGTRLIDFDGDGSVDHSFGDRPFNVRSLIGNAVLRWEYRPGSAIYVVWQRVQEDHAPVGDFDFGRDLDALLGAPVHNVFMVKMNWWIGY